MEQAPKPVFAAIPDPTADIQGLYKTVLAMKIAAEQIIGTRTGPVGNERKVSIFTTDDTLPPSAGMNGDLWLLNGGAGAVVSMMVSGRWVVIWPPVAP
jgi:hypothetical protein